MPHVILSTDSKKYEKVKSHNQSNMTRKPISTSKTLDGDLCALCNDGTIWVFTKNSRERSPTWKRFPDVPQPDTSTGTKLKNKPCQECGGLIVSREFSKSTCVNGHEFLTDLVDLPTLTQ